MLKNLKDCEIFAYTDDILVLVDPKNLKGAQESLQADDKINILLHGKGLFINSQQTVLMHIRNKRFDI